MWQGGGTPVYSVLRSSSSVKIKVNCNTSYNVTHFGNSQAVVILKGQTHAQSHKYSTLVPNIRYQLQTDMHACKKNWLNIVHHIDKQLDCPRSSHFLLRWCTAITGYRTSRKLNKTSYHSEKRSYTLVCIPLYNIIILMIYIAVVYLTIHRKNAM